MTTYDLGDIMARLPVMQVAALAAMVSPITADAVDYWPYQQEAFPYFWNRIASMSREAIAGDTEVHTYFIDMAMVIGHLTEGYQGETSQAAYARIPAVLDFFRLHRDLADGSTYTTAPDFLWIEQGGALISGIPNGTRTLANSGLGVSQVAIVFTLEVPLLWQVY